MMEEQLPYLEIRLLGQFRVLQNGVEVAGFEAPQPRALLTLLVFAQGSAVSYPFLAQELWGEDEVTVQARLTAVGLTAETKRRIQEHADLTRKGARNNLRVCLHRLLKGRTGDRAFAEPRLDPRRLDRSERGKVLLDLSNADIDVLNIEAAFRSGNIEVKQQAVDLYTGDLLSECTWKSIVRHRAAVRDQYCKILESLTAAATACGNFAEAVRYQTLRNAFDPRNEELVERLMNLHIQCGELNAAQAVYDKYAQSLPLHIEPGKALQAKSFTLQSEILPPPARWTPPPFARIPGTLPDIIGRENDLLEVMNLLDTARFVTLKGMPGIGKTFLARHVARRISILFNHRVVFVDLTECRTLVDVERRILTCLGTNPNPSICTAEVIKRVMGQDLMLMVLDNCEQIVAHSGPFLEDLLWSATKLKVIATSHIPWRSLSGEKVKHVLPLSLPPSKLLRLCKAIRSQHWRGTAAENQKGMSPETVKVSSELLATELPKLESVALYLTEAASIRPNIQLTPQNAHTIGELISLLGGLPLAIKLAAGTSHTLTPEQTLDLLEKNDFGRLPYSLGTLPKKHQSVYAALKIAFDLLPQRIQAIFVSLAVFRGGFTLEAAQEIGGEHTAEALIRLQERSLLAADAIEGVMRFSMLDVVHGFLKGLLVTSPQYMTTSQRHAEFYQRLASEADPHLIGPDQAVWLRRLRLEAENFKSALGWCLESKNIELGLKLANAHWRVWYLSSTFHEGYDILSKLLDAAPSEIDSAVRLKSNGAAGIFAMQLGDYVNARRYFHAAIVLADLLERPLSKANAYSNLGNVESFSGNFSEAESMQFAAIAIYRGVEDERNIAILLGNIASNATRAQDPRKAIEYGTQAVERLGAIGDRFNVAVAHVNLAEAYLQERRPSDAIAEISEALDTASNLSAWHIVAECHALLLMLAVSVSAWNTAASLIGMHETLHLGQEWPLTAPHHPRFQSLRERTATVLGSGSYREAIKNSSQFAAEQCVISMQAIAANMKDTLPEFLGPQ